MRLSKREYIALELLKSKPIDINEAYDMADMFIKAGANIENPNEVKEATGFIFSRPTSDLSLSVRSENCLVSQGFLTVGDVVKITESEIKKIPNIGKKAVAEIKETLESKELRLGMSDEDITNHPY